MQNKLIDALRAFINSNEGEALNVMKHKLYDAALVETRANVTAAAKKLGMGRTTLNNYVNEWESKPR